MKPQSDVRSSLRVAWIGTAIAAVSIGAEPRPAQRLDPPGPFTQLEPVVVTTEKYEPEGSVSIGSPMPKARTVALNEVTTRPRLIRRPPFAPTEGIRQLGSYTTRTTVSYMVDQAGKVWNLRVLKVVIDGTFSEEELRIAYPQSSPGAALSRTELGRRAASEIAEVVANSFRQATFAPAQKDGNPVAVEIVEEIPYRLGAEPDP